MDAQREAVTRYVQNRGQIIAEFIEVESGKKHTNRPQLLAALAECRKCRAVLVIARLDRLARNVAFIANLMNSDVEFVAVDMPHANRLTIHILAAVAEHEREMISQRTKAALAAAKARGRKLGNPNYKEALARARAALGYRPPAPEILRLMAEWRGRGDTLRGIADRLNEINNRTPQGARWYAASVRSALLRNRPEVYTSLLKEARNGSTPLFAGSTAVREPAQRGGMPMPSGIKEAERMFDLFTSVGARSFVITKTDIEQKLIWGKSYTAAQLREKLPAMVRTAEIRKSHHLPDGQTVMAGENLIVRPTGPEVTFVQLDDLSTEQLARVRPAAFMIIATSPGNHQAWIACGHVDKSESKDVVRRVRKAVGDADMSASGATRVTGLENFKMKYAPEFPTVSIIHGVPGRVMILEQLQPMGLLAEPERVKPFSGRVSKNAEERSWPDYARCVQGAPMNHDGTAVDISRADYFWCFLSAQRGHDPEEIASRLMQLSSKAKENGERYASVTAQNAAAAERGRQRSRA